MWLFSIEILNRLKISPSLKFAEKNAGRRIINGFIIRNIASEKTLLFNTDGYGAQAVWDSYICSYISAPVQLITKNSFLQLRFEFFNGPHVFIVEVLLLSHMLTTDSTLGRVCEKVDLW